MGKRNLFPIFLVVLSVIVFSSLGYLLFKASHSAPPPSIATTAEDEVKFIFASKIPEYKIKGNSVNNNLLKDVLSKLLLLSFQSVPFRGEPVNGQWTPSLNRISPREITITLSPQRELENNPVLAQRTIFTFASAKGKPIITYLAGHLSNDDKFDLPIYIDPEGYKSFRDPVDVLLTRDILFGLFLNFRVGPIGDTPYKDFTDAVGTINGKLLEIEHITSLNILDMVKHALLPKKVYAQQCSGSPVCGNNVQTQKCSGDNSVSCTSDAICSSLGIGTCQIFGSCQPNGTTGSCFCSGGSCGTTGTNFVCFPTCPCVVSGGCNKNPINPPPPPPGPTPTPGGGGGGCGSCSDYCAGAGQCSSQGGSIVGSRCSGGSCSPGSSPCLICGGGGGGGPPPPPPGPTAACGDFCNSSADCKPSCSGQPVTCNTSIHKCVNPNCPTTTVPGCICACGAGSSLTCGQQCAGGCTGNSICTFVNNLCTNAGSTYCTGLDPSDPTGIKTFNPNYIHTQCGPGFTFALTRLNPPPATYVGLTQADAQASCPAGTINARVHIIGTSDITCSAINNSTSYLTGTSFNLSPALAPGAQTQTGSSYVSWRASTSNTYTLLVTPPSGGGWVLQNACWIRNPTAPTNGTGLSATVTATNQDTLVWDIGYSLGTPWVQTQGGEVIVANWIKSLMTPLASPRLFSVNGGGGYPGGVFYGSTGAAPYNFNADPSDITNGANYVSSTNWLVNEPGDGFSKDPFKTDWYQYFLYRFDLSPVSGATPDYPNPILPITKPASRTKPYLVSGNMETSGNWVVGNGENIIFLVDGNVTIKGKINITGTGFFAMIAKGNITIDPTVGVSFSSSTPVVEGFYVTSKTGSFITGQSTNAGTERFVGKGSFIAGSFLLQRDLSSVGHNADTAAELFLYSPQLLLTMPENMKEVKVR